MRIGHINAVFYGSTGKIMLQIAQKGKPAHRFLLCAPKGRHNPRPVTDDCYAFGSRLAEDSHLLLSRFTGLHGFFSAVATKQLLNKIDEFSPDIIHLHNLHNCYVNLPMLFDYIKKKNIKTVWTLHDCWSFTGRCPHFDLIKCDKWKTECHSCPLYRLYPQSFVDSSRFLHEKKKEWFKGVENMTLVTPSKWLESTVKQSFLKDYPIKVINNGIDLNVFKPANCDFKKKYNCEGKYIVLGVSFAWGRGKGLDVFAELANTLGDDYQVVLVGTTAEIDKQLPKNVISIHKTTDQAALAEIYTAADVFVNATREEVFGLVNIEALACGTPVITFNTGGSPECIDDTCGVVVEVDDIGGLKTQIVRISTQKPFTQDVCINRAKLFDKDKMFEEYIRLYENNI